MGAIDDLKGLYDAHRLIPFIGAGVSASVEWEDRKNKKHGPSWTEMVIKPAGYSASKTPTCCGCAERTCKSWNT